ncbi:hypothetical protein chiPu_0005097 [Chiloscyllium punctatum]|uniref:Uncharacterized protein n=1 Tax=Chiloscyllium punctatum TaxID=137246 RepID=A0A401S8F0_CHIPU|nr:hypothetical protein [Chiloscyllium punctatum]
MSQGDHSKTSLPSVTRILQLTMSLEQAFYLERWKRRMITELGQDGFKEYSKNWKTSEKPKPYFRNTFDNPLQVAAYAGALNHDDNYNFQVERGLIVVAYKDGSPAHAHFMDRELFLTCWKKWLLRLEKYKKQIHAST